MKTSFFKKLSVSVLLLVLALTVSTAARAQANCPYTITNNLPCPIDVQYTIFGTGCYYASQVNIPPGGSYTIQCWEFQGCETAEIEINLLQVAGFPFVCKPPYSNTVASMNQNADASGMFPGNPCATSIFMNWTPGGCNIHP